MGKVQEYVWELEWRDKNDRSIIIVARSLDWAEDIARRITHSPKDSKFNFIKCTELEIYSPTNGKDSNSNE